MINRIMKAKPAYGAQLNPGHALARGLIGRWLFNEYGSLRVYDLVGHQLATLTGTVPWTSGRSGPALNFDGTTGYVAAASSIYNGITGATFSAWTYWNNPQSNDGVIFSRGSGTNILGLCVRFNSVV